MCYGKFILVTLAVICHSLLGFAQQRQKEDINKILTQHTQFHKLKQPLQLIAGSSAISKDNRITKQKEAFYIYSSNSPTERAFVIISGNEKMPAVLAYSDKNSFDTTNIPPAVRYWLETYTLQITDNSTTTPTNQQKLHLPIQENGVEPILGNICWGQSQPYNNTCPKLYGERTLTGCVATAMAQVMKHHSFPDKARGYKSYTSRTNHISINHDFTKDIFDWENMLNTYNNTTYTNEQANAVSVLMSSCGIAVEMDYGTSSQGGSGAYQADLIKGYIENFGYDEDAALVIKDYCNIEDWHTLLIEELNAGRPVNYAGVSMLDGGHSFIIDGYALNNNTYPDYHINWGWNGSCDGYYQIANLHPHEDENYATNNSFSRSQQMTIGIMPDDNKTTNKRMLQSSKINSNLSKVKRGEKLECNVSTLDNFSYKDFSGKVAVALKGDNGQLVPICKEIELHLDYLQGIGSTSFICSIPENITLGNYQLYLIYKLFDSEEWSLVLSTSNPEIAITENTEDNPSNKDNWSEISCSDFELLQETDETIISANVYEIANLQTEAFIGDISFVLADEHGIPLFSFGNKTNIPELGFYEFLTEPIYIYGSIDKEIPNGHYRLYLTAQREKQNTNSYVILYDINTPEIPTKELYYNVEVTNNIIYIDNKEYKIIPTAIKEVNHSQTQSDYIFSIQGQKEYFNKRHKGIYIIQDKGKTKKIKY